MKTYVVYTIPDIQNIIYILVKLCFNFYMASTERTIHVWIVRYVIIRHDT